MWARTDDGRWDVSVTLGSTNLRMGGAYEALSITNDFLAGLLFLVGSILLFWKTTQILATWCFTLGWVLFVAQPAIRLVRRIHLGPAGGGEGEAARDF